jgi:hypothetical protein
MAILGMMREGPSQAYFDDLTTTKGTMPPASRSRQGEKSTNRASLYIKDDAVGYSKCFAPDFSIDFTSTAV